MRITRHILTVLILLTSGLMAAGEVPELLTLSDDLSNDIGCTVLGEQRRPIREAAERKERLREPAAGGNPTGLISNFSSTVLLKPSLLVSLPMLCVQRK